MEENLQQPPAQTPPQEPKPIYSTTRKRKYRKLLPPPSTTTRCNKPTYSHSWPGLSGLSSATDAPSRPMVCPGSTSNIHHPRDYGINEHCLPPPTLNTERYIQEFTPKHDHISAKRSRLQDPTVPIASHPPKIDATTPGTGKNQLQNAQPTNQYLDQTDLLPTALDLSITCLTNAQSLTSPPLSPHPLPPNPPLPAYPDLTKELTFHPSPPSLPPVPPPSPPFPPDILDMIPNHKALRQHPLTITRNRKTRWDSPTNPVFNDSRLAPTSPSLSTPHNPSPDGHHNRVQKATLLHARVSSTPKIRTPNPYLWSDVKASLLRYKNWTFPPPQTATPKSAVLPQHRSLKVDPSEWEDSPSTFKQPGKDTNPILTTDILPLHSGSPHYSEDEEFVVCKKLDWSESDLPIPLATNPYPPPGDVHFHPTTTQPDLTIIKPGPGFLGLLLNVRSLPCHRVEVRDLIEFHDPDIVLLTETWLGDDANPVLHSAIPPNYRALLVSRDTRGGGVAIILKSNYSISQDRSSKIPDCEFILAKCDFDKAAFISFLLVYRPPHSNKGGSFPYKFADALSSIMNEHKNLVILGDFNIRVEDPKYHMAGPFLRLLEALGFVQGIKEPTHKFGHWLDGIYYVDGLVFPLPLHSFPWTDHKMIPFLIHKTSQVTKPPTTVSMGRKWKSLDVTETLIPEMLSHVPAEFSPLTLGENPFVMPHLNPSNLSLNVKTFDNWITKTLDKVLPNTQTKHHNTRKNDWFNDNTTSLKNSMRSAYRIWHKNQSNQNLLKYKIALRHYRSALQKTKRHFFSNRITTAACPSRELFKIIEEFKGNREPEQNFDTTEFCNKMATHFTDKENLLHSKIEKITKTIGPHIPDKEPTHTPAELLTLKPLNENEFYKLMSGCKTAGSQEDPCPPNVYKTLALDPTIGEVLRKIINSSLVLGIVPPEFKSAHIKPLLKKAGLDPSDGNNFRGLTKSRFIPKISEKIVTSQFNDHVEANFCLDPYQAGFRAKHSTETILVGLCDELKTEIDKEGMAALILLDLSAAFDTVDHQILLTRLDNIGIRGTAKNWVASFLEGRSLQVSTANCSSTPFNCRFGVPQGSPLSPLLFNIYLTPLLSIIHKFGLTCFNYADDTQLIYKIRSTAAASPQNLEGCMLEIARWMTSNHLLINPGKTELLICSANKVQHWDLPWPALLGDSPSGSEVVTSLGCRINQKLNPRDQVKATSKTCFFLMRNLRRILPYLAFPQQVSAVMALILSRLDYANALLAGGPQECIDILQRTQNAAARLLTKTKPWEHITPSLISLHWLPISRRVTFKILCLTFQAYHGTGPSFLNKVLTKKISPRDLRNTQDRLLETPRVNSVRMGEATFAFQGPTLWNALPNNIRHIDSFPAFKTALKNWLFINFKDDNTIA